MKVKQNSVNLTPIISYSNVLEELIKLNIPFKYQNGHLVFSIRYEKDVKKIVERNLIA